MPKTDGDPRGLITGRRAIVALTILALLTIAAPHRAGAASKQLGCRPAGARTITQSSLARVFRLGGRSYGCLFGANRDLRTGAIRRRPKPYEQLALASEEPDAGVTDIVLNARGSVAWIVRDIYRSPVELEVRKADPASPSTLLDAGAAIEAVSLTLGRDGTLHWTNGGVTGAGTLR
jgi:hypothetical protein